MLQPSIHGFLRATCLLTIIACGGCAAGPAADIAPDYVPAEVQIGSERAVVSEGRIDTTNRYMSTVMVTTAFSDPKQGTRVKTCSGVLIEAHAVLTAGHCVCDVRRPVPPEANDAAVTDPSTCAKTTNITLLRYQPPEETALQTPVGGSLIPPAVNIGPYRGTVQVHEDLRILYKELETSTGLEMNTEYSNADIAVILLEEPLRGYTRPIKLAEEPVRLKERLLLVGYGAALLGQSLDTPVRRYGENTVVSIKEDGSTFHLGTQLEIAPSYRGEKPRVNRLRGSYSTSGDSGGPCFRERKGALELVGIAKSTHGPPVVLSVYTSTHAYLRWLRQKIGSAGRTD
jgi:hypothetical protein